MKIVISDKARSDLLQLYAYLAARSPAAACKAVAAVDTKFANIAEFPFIGRERSALADGLRSFVSGTQVIFYRISGEEIVVVRVLDGRRDIVEGFKR